MTANAMAMSPFAPDATDGRALQRALRWSFGVHVGVLIVLFVIPKTWFTRPVSHPTYMTISLGGTPGPRSTGMTPIGGRTVEQVAPPPKRTEPPRPKDEPAPTPIKATAQQPVANTVQVMKPPPTRAPVTGPQTVVGNTVVDTGARGLGAGLTFGGGGGAAGEIDISKDFCCREYLDTLTQQIASHWNKDQKASGVATLKFTIQRDGTITNITIEQSSGTSYLDRIARNALEDTRQLPPLPAAYTLPTLIIHLKFPYNGTP